MAGGGEGSQGFAQTVLAEGKGSHYSDGMGKKPAAKKSFGKEMEEIMPSRLSAPGKPSSLIDTRFIYCGDCPEQLNSPATSAAAR